MKGLLRILLPLLLCVPALVHGAVDLRVEISGVSGSIRETVAANLSLMRERTHPLLTDARVQRLYRRAQDEIGEALQPFGYYAPAVDASLQRRQQTWVARFNIRPGRPVTVSELELQLQGPGRDEPELRQVIEQFPLERGDRLVHARYEQGKRDLLQDARDLGYFDAALERHRVVVDPDRYSARVELRLATGPRYRFGAVSFNELPLRESFLRRYFTFEPGDPWDAQKLFELQRAFADSDYFQRVDVVPMPGQAEGLRVPVAVQLEMRPRNRYTVGLGYGTDTGPRVRAGIERRWANSRGHRVQADLVASSVLVGLTASYRVPGKQPRTDYQALVTRLEREDTDALRRDTAVVAVSDIHLYGPWQRTLSLNLHDELYRVASVEQRSRFLYPSLGWQRVVVDDRLHPQQGWRLATEARVASAAIGSSADLLQGFLRSKTVQPAWNWGRLIMRVEVGASYAPDFTAVPASLRFFAGGDQSVRGYGYQELAPTDAAGEPLGGKYLLVGSVELDRFWGNWGAAVFVDAGNAFDDRSRLELFTGAGFGLRWKLPFGTLRLDLASALSLEDNPWRIHLTIGPLL